MAATDVRQGEGVVATLVASPSTPGANSEAITNGRLGVIVASNGRVSPVNVFEDAQKLAVSSSVVFLTPPSRCMGSSRAAITMSFGFDVFCSS